MHRDAVPCRDRGEPAEWHAERFWPACYGPAWVLDRLREYVGRAGYRPLIDLDVPPADAAAGN